MPTDLPLNELAAVFARIKGMLLSEETVNHAVDLLAQAAVEAIPGAIGAGVSVMDEQGRRTSAGSTDKLVLAADGLQYDLGEGPCLTAWASTQVVRSNNLAAEARWPQWSSAAARMGIRSVLSAPLIFKTESLGAIKVYSLQEDAFDQHSEHLLALFAGPAATLLANIQSSEVPHKISSELKTAVRSRDNIALARGILMEREGLTSDEAMSRLLGMARRDRLSLLAVSDQLVQGVSGRRQD